MDKMTWDEIESEIKKLAAKIHFIPDIIIGIVRGGIIPARLLSNHFNIKNMYCLTVTKIGSKRKITSDILEDIKNKKILLVEDVLETGKSLTVAKEYLEKKGAIVKTACLYTTPLTQTEPNYFLKELSTPPTFLWE